MQLGIASNIEAVKLGCIPYQARLARAVIEPPVRSGPLRPAP